MSANDSTTAISGTTYSSSTVNAGTTNMTLASFGRSAAGTAVTLSGSGATRTFTAPASQTRSLLTFGATCTDNGGAVSGQDTVTITVLPATDFYLSSDGAWTPMQTVEL